MWEMKHLRLLIAIEDGGSLSAAARELGYSQPAVSQQLQVLEHAARTPLVIRDRPGTRFTEAGAVLTRHARMIVAAAARAESEVSAIAGLRRGNLRLVSFPSAAATVLPRAFADLRTRLPGLSFTLREAESAAAMAMLRAGECDIAIVYEWVTPGLEGRHRITLEPGERSVTLVEESVQVAMPEAHSQASHACVELESLAGETWIAGCPVCRAQLLEIADHSGFAPRIGFETDDYVALQRLVGAGLGVALVTDLMLDAARDDRGLVLRQLMPAVKRVVMAVTSEAVLQVPGVSETIGAFVEAGRMLAGDGAGHVAQSRSSAAL